MELALHAFAVQGAKIFLHYFRWTPQIDLEPTLLQYLKQRDPNKPQTTRMQILSY